MTELTILFFGLLILSILVLAGVLAVRVFLMGLDKARSALRGIGSDFDPYIGVD